MPVRTARAVWNGTLREGSGEMSFADWTGPYTWSSRFEESEGTNPEELIAAAHAGCFSMALSGDLVRAGHTPKRIETTAQVTIERVEGRQTITRIKLTTRASVPGIDQAAFQAVADGAKQGCPVSRALAAVPIELEASLAE